MRKRSLSHVLLQGEQVESPLLHDRDLQGGALQLPELGHLEEERRREGRGEEEGVSKEARRRG